MMLPENHCYEDCMIKKKLNLFTSNLTSESYKCVNFNKLNG